jgi:ABC-type polysaccharide/polyol phosphate export permease
LEPRVKSLIELWSYRNLIFNLAQRELRARYKKSVLGWLWSLINPLSMLAIYSLVFGVFLGGTAPTAGNGHTEVFALYLFCGLYVWNLFNNIVMGSISALQSSGTLLNKVYFPPACPALANALTVVLQAFIEGGILAVIMIAIGNASFTFLLFPFLIVFVTIFALGIGLVFSVYNAYYRDVGYLVAIAMNLLFYATPIVYPLSVVPERLAGIPMREIISLNPIAQFVQWSRDLFYLLEIPSPASMGGVISVSILTFFVGWLIFVRKARNITEEL